MPFGDWSDQNRVSDYLAREIPHRDVAEALLLEALPEKVERVLDLGTGDGRLLRLVLREHPGVSGIGLDFSEPMLERARERLGLRQSRLGHATDARAASSLPCRKWMELALLIAGRS